MILQSDLLSTWWNYNQEYIDKSFDKVFNKVNVIIIDKIENQTWKSFASR